MNNHWTTISGGGFVLPINSILIAEGDLAA
jgi:hypothetical protein